MALFQNYPSHRHADLRRLYQDAAEQHGDKPLFLQKGEKGYREISYRRFADATDALSALLRYYGFGKKSVIIIGAPCYEWVLAFMATICTGVAVPLNEAFDAKAISAVAAHCDAGLIICDAETDKRLAAISHPLPRIRFSQLKSAVAQGDSILQGDCPATHPSPIDPDAMHAIFYTAGTTDTPKGVMLSHRNLCANVFEMGQMIEIEKEDVFLSIQPLHQLYECACGILFPISRGATVAFAGGMQRFQQSLKEVSPSVILCAPSLPEALYKRLWQRIRSQKLEKKVLAYVNSTNAIPKLKARLSAKQKIFASLHQGFGGKLRLLICSGDTVEPSVLSGLRDFGFLALQCYAVTEGGPIVAINRDTYFLDESVGTATPNALLDVSESDGERAGEIRFHGDSVMLGYYKEPTLTASVLRGGWLYTGDLGYLDEKGFLYIVGRKSNAIRLTDGKAVYPEELEKLLLDTGIIEEAAVVGYPCPDGTKTDVVAILCPDYTVLQEPNHNGPTPQRLAQNLKKAIASVNAQVSPHKQISRYLLATHGFPKTKNGDLQREAVAATYLQDYRNDQSSSNA